MTESRDYPYRTVAAQLRTRVAGMSPHSQLPTIAELAYDYEVSPNVVIRAQRLLKDEGLIYGVNGLGTFVGRRDSDLPTFTGPSQN
jgi:DNA-binding GntR family transcriptional regulator